VVVLAVSLPPPILSHTMAGAISGSALEPSCAVGPHATLTTNKMGHSCIAFRMEALSYLQHRWRLRSNPARSRLAQVRGAIRGFTLQNKGNDGIWNKIRTVKQPATKGDL
jgi:hypothetical protein